MILKKGEFFGIVGKNGSGKSTLLKSIAQIYSPTEGSVRVNGSLVPFIELGVGFNPELTGRENVFLNGALLGFSHKEMELMYDDIVEFSELADFMEEKLKNYSSGMQVRLAFSVAIKARGDILSPLLYTPLSHYSHWTITKIILTCNNKRKCSWQMFNYTIISPAV